MSSSMIPARPSGPRWIPGAGLSQSSWTCLTGRYTKPVRVVVFNVAGSWCRDASVEIAHELRRRCDLQLRDIPFFLQDFVVTKAAIATFSSRCRCACSSARERLRPPET